MAEPASVAAADAALARSVGPWDHIQAAGNVARRPFPSILRKLERFNIEVQESDKRRPAPPISMKSGTRLVREWRGVTHTVLVHADGLEWSGRRYASLTIIAREITGAHWSGPRFFGLRKRAAQAAASAENEHAQA